MADGNVAADQLRLLIERIERLEFERVLQVATLANVASQRILETIREGDEKALADCAWDVASPLLRAAMLAIDAGGIHPDEDGRAAVRAAIAEYIEVIPPLSGQASSLQRDARYRVFKIKRLSEEQIAQLDALDLPEVTSVVIEADWPEYEPVWGMIEKRVLSEEGAK